MDEQQTLQAYLDAHPVVKWFAQRTERTLWMRDDDDGISRRLYVGYFVGFERNGSGILEVSIQFWSKHPWRALHMMTSSGRCPLEFDGQTVL